MIALGEPLYDIRGELCPVIKEKCKCLLQLARDNEQRDQLLECDVLLDLKGNHTCIIAIQSAKVC